MIVVAARSVLTFACLMVVGCLLTLAFVRPGTGEFVITVVTLAVGGLLLALSAVVLRATYVRETSMIEIDPEPANQISQNLPETPLRPSENPRTRPGRTKEEM